MTRFAFRINGSKDIGMGHLMRCLSLAEHLPGTSLFLINDNAVMAEKIKEFNHEYRIIRSVTDRDFAMMVKALTNYPNDIDRTYSSEEAELKELTKLIQEEKIDVLITDLIAPSNQYLCELKETGVLLVSIDELGKADFPSDLVFNCNAVSLTKKFSYKTAKETKVYTGKQYTLLRKEFSKSPKVEVREHVKKILVTCGGTDMKGLSLKALKSIVEPFEIILVGGIDFKFRKDLDKIVNEMKKEMKMIGVRENVKDMSLLMRSVDMAIASAGTTMYELAALGVPSIILCQYEHQNEFSTEMGKEEKILINLGLGEDIQEEDITQAVADLSRRDVRKAMSEAAQRTIDGRGAQRVAKIIQEAVA